MLAGLSAALGASPLSLTPTHSPRRPSFEGAGVKRGFGEALAEAAAKGSAPPSRPSSLRLLSTAVGGGVTSPVLAASVSWPWLDGQAFMPPVPTASSSATAPGPEDEMEVGLDMGGEAEAAHTAHAHGGKRLRGRED